MKRTHLLAAGVALALLQVSAIAGAHAAGRQVTVTHTSPLDGLYGDAASAFKKVVEEKSDGAFEVVIQRLDNEREALESVQLGSQECSFSSAGPLGNFVPETRVLDVPFLFDDRDQARSALDGEVGQELLALLPARGLIGVAWLENGFRHLTTGKKQINSPEDMKGLKVRTMENQVHIKAWSAAGVLATPIAWAETPPALQQGTVDGQENPIPVILANNIDELQDNLYLTRHVYSPGILVCAPSFWDGLSDDEKAIFEEAAAAAVEANRARVQHDEEVGVQALRDRGMNVVEIEDLQPYRDAMASANAEFEAQFGADKLNRLREWGRQ